jgi:hypothetical protein
VRFNDSELQRCYESNLADVGPEPGELSQIKVLLSVRAIFANLEGEHSARVHETVDHLLSPELRPALRRWYRLANSGLDTSGLKLRDDLNSLAGEQLEGVREIPHNPT